ncbi:MAG TPA: sugar-binding protein [Pyrinomonadaceae bacterium]|nr:sugar-binding protein [Pyrinomonadaceae bacterium]
MCIRLILSLFFFCISAVAQLPINLSPRLVLPGTVVNEPAPAPAAPVQIMRFAQPPIIDGNLTDEVWQSASTLKISTQIQPGDNIAASKATELKIGYDEKHLYFGFHAYDEPAKIRASLRKRDDIWEDDNVGMFVDTFNDRRQAYAFFFNPLRSTPCTRAPSWTRTPPSN